MNPHVTYRIPSRYTGETLYEGEAESLKALAVSHRANLTGADLTRANLSGADLYRAKGIIRYLTTPLYMLRDQPGPIRLYKLTNKEGHGPFRGGITYQVGGEYAVEDADTDEDTQCAAGINLATLDWCIREWRTGYRILVAEFTAGDIAAIPVGSDGKARVHRCKIAAEKDLVELGLVESEATA